MKSSKGKTIAMSVVILAVVAVALGLSIYQFGKIFKDTTSSSQISEGSSITTSMPAESTSSDSGNSAVSEDMTGTDSSTVTSETVEYVDEEALKAILAQLYGSDMFGAAEPKDLLEKPEFMALLKDAGMTDEEIVEAITQLQTIFEAQQGGNSATSAQPTA